MAEEWTQERIEARVRLEALRQGVDPNLAVAVAKQESNLRADNPGDNGASRGVFHMQRAAAIDAGIDPARRDDPETGIVGGIRYLKQRLALSKGDVPQALSRYNRGTPDYRGIGDPDYVYHVMRHYPGHPLGKEPTDQEGYRARLNRTFGRGTADEGGERATMASQTTAEKPWWDKFVPRFGPRSAEAAAPAQKWYDDLVPDKEPTAATPPAPIPVSQPAATPQATTGQGKWYDVVPEKEPASPPAATPGAPAQTPLPGEPPLPDVAPTPMERPPAVQSPPAAGAVAPQRVAQDQWFREQAPQAVQDLETGVGERPQLLDPAGVAPTLSETAPAGFRLMGADGKPHPQAAHIAQILAQQGTPLSGTYYVRADASPEALTQNPASAISPTPSTLGVVRGGRDVALDVGYGLAGGVVGSAVGGVPGAIAGPVIAQGALDRARTQLGMREQEEPLAQVGPLNIYPSDALNAGLGLLVSAYPVAKQALRKSYFGRAVTAAKEATAAAHGEWKTLHDTALKAQAEGREVAYREGVAKADVARRKYEKLATDRNALIQSRETEYKTLMHEAEQEQANARLADKQAGREAIADEYGRAREVVEDYQGKAQARQAEIAAAPEAQKTTWEVEQAALQRKRNQWRQDYLGKQAQRQEKGLEAIKAGEQEYVEGVEAVGVAERSQQQTITKAQQLPGIKRQAEPSWKLYDDWRAEAKGVDLPLESYKSKLADVRASRIDSISGEPTPFPAEVERIALDLEKAGATGNMQSVHEQIKKLGKLSQSPNGDVRRSAGQVAEILMDAMEEAPTALASLRKANAAWRRELVTKQMHDFVEGATHHTQQGQRVINVGKVMDSLGTAMKKPLFAKSLTAEETQTFYDNLKLLAEKNPQVPAAPTRPRPELLPGGAPQTPALPEPPEIRGLSAPKEVPEPLTPPKNLPQGELPGGLADIEVPKPTTVEFPKEPTIPKEISTPAPEHVPGTVAVARVPYRGPGETPPARVEPTIGEHPKTWPGVAKLGTYGAMAYTFTRLGVSTPLIDKALIAAAVGGSSVVVGKQMNWLLSKAMLNSRYAPALQAAMAADGTIHPAFFPLMRAALTPAERRELDRDTRSPQKARR